MPGPDFHVGQRVYWVTDKYMVYELGSDRDGFVWDDSIQHWKNVWPRINASATIISDKFKLQPSGGYGAVVADHYQIFLDYSNKAQIVRACYLSTEPFEGYMKDFLGDRESEVEVV